jgi:hypothetical protein
VPRVNKARKNRAGAVIKCGKCNLMIEPGENYFFWEPRYGGKQVRCYRHYPRQSEITTSKMSEVYAATEEAEDQASAYDGIEVSDFESMKQAVVDVITGVAEEYETAAEHFGGAGENAERAEALEAFSQEVDSVEFEEFNSWWGDNCPEDLEVDAQQAWREDMFSRLTEAMANTP